MRLKDGYNPRRKREPRLDREYAGRKESIIRAYQARAKARQNYANRINMARELNDRVRWRARFDP